MWLLLYTYFSHTPSTKQRSTQPLNLFEFISTSQKPLLPAPVLSHFLCTLVIFHCVNSPTWFDLTSLYILVQWICFFLLCLCNSKKKHSSIFINIYSQRWANNVQYTTRAVTKTERWTHFTKLNWALSIQYLYIFAQWDDGNFGSQHNQRQMKSSAQYWTQRFVICSPLGFEPGGGLLSSWQPKSHAYLRCLCAICGVVT